MEGEVRRWIRRNKDAIAGFCIVAGTAAFGGFIAGAMWHYVDCQRIFGWGWF